MYKIYIRSHLNDEMMLRILELSDLIKKEEIGELIRINEKYLKENGYKYLNNGIYLYLSIYYIIYLFIFYREIIIQTEN